MSKRPPPWAGAWPTCPKVDGSIEPLQGPAGHLPVCVPIGGEEDCVFTQEVLEHHAQVAKVVIIAGKIAPIFILHLPHKGENIRISQSEFLRKDCLELYRVSIISVNHLLLLVCSSEASPLIPGRWWCSPHCYKARASSWAGAQPASCPRPSDNLQQETGIECLCSLN